MSLAQICAILPSSPFSILDKKIWYLLMISFDSFDNEIVHSFSCSNLYSVSIFKNFSKSVLFTFSSINLSKRKIYLFKCGRSCIYLQNLYLVPFKKSSKIFLVKMSHSLSVFCLPDTPTVFSELLNTTK